MSRSVAALSLIPILLASVSVPPPAAADEIRGAWLTREYHLADGTVHPLSGTIFFAETRWQVLFFVLDADGEPRRGSAEGGTYSVDGDRLEFRHEHNLSVGQGMEGLAESALRMTVRSAANAEAEPARFELSGDQLIIFFPSGNRMRFERAR